jgi:hypothetical protein
MKVNFSSGGYAGIREWYGKFTSSFEIKLIPQGNLIDNLNFKRGGVPSLSRNNL